MVHWIYCPKSGTSIFASHTPPGGGLVRITHPNGCVHVVGGVCLPLTERPGGVRRERARRWAVQALVGTPHVAIDDRGSVGVIVPLRYAYATARRASALLGIGGPDRVTQIGRVLWQAAVSCIDTSDPVALAESGDAPDDVSADASVEITPESVIVRWPVAIPALPGREPSTATTELVVRSTWGRPQVDGAITVTDAPAAAAGEGGPDVTPLRSYPPEW